MLSTDLLPKLSVKTRIEVFVSELQPDNLCLLSAYLDRHYDTVALFRSAIESFLKSQKIIGRQKSLVEILCSSLQSFCCGSTVTGLVSSNSSSGIGIGSMSQLNESGAVTYNSFVSSSFVSTLPILVLCYKNTLNFYRVLM